MGGDTPQQSAGPLAASVATLRRQPGLTGILLDFDGTLAPIVEDPASARPVPGAIPVLRGLVDRYRLVGVVSGRPAAFLAAHLRVPGLVRVGSYGLEEVTSSGVVEVAGASGWRAAVRRAAEGARAGAPDGVLVEDKGLSVTIHYRAAPDAEDWVRAFGGGQGKVTGLAVHQAKQSLELRPPLAVDKGTVVAALVERAALTAACFCGDDTGDLPAFAALTGLGHVVRVAVRSDETPSELLAAADLVVEGPGGVLGLLRALLA